MSALVKAGTGQPFGPGGLFHPPGSPAEAALSELFAMYKRVVASRYRALGPAEISSVWLPQGPLQVSPKVDGELCYLVQDGDQTVLFSHNGRAITGDVPVLKEAAALLGPRAVGRTILAGELFAVPRSGRPRVGDLGGAMSGGASAEVARIGFFAFDILSGGDNTTPAPGAEYPEKLATLQRLLQGGKRVQVVKTKVVEGADNVRAPYTEWVEGGKGEGLVARSNDGRTYKIKPVFTLDAAVVGFTDRSDDPEQAGSLLLALVREDGTFQLVGACGNLGEEGFRRALRARLAPAVVPSRFSHANSQGAFYRFVRPEIVVEVACTDIQAEDGDGAPVERMVLRHGPEGWSALQLLPCVSILHPVLSRLREDKAVNAVDCRIGQVSERVVVPEMARHAEAPRLAASELLRREVGTKPDKGGTAVRKLLVWATHKESAGWPAYVATWIDFSAARAEPLKRELKVAPDQDAILAIADGMVAENIKKGWVKM